jgi:hypothetical protein
MINKLNEPLNYRQEIEKLRLEIEELEKSYRVNYPKRFTKNEFEFELQVEPSMNMSQGPWQRLGITIEQIMFRSIKDLRTSSGSSRDFYFDMTVGETIKTAKDMCTGFFDKWERELDILQFKYFTEIKEALLREKNNKISEKNRSKEAFAAFTPT